MRAWGHRASEDLTYDTDWNDDKTRRHFISKVCSIIAMQMAFTVLFTAIFIFVQEPRLWLIEYALIFIIVGGLGSLIIGIMLLCYMKIARKVPLNYILLALFTILKSMVVAGVSVLYRTDRVMCALGITFIVCASLALFALFAPCDFTGWGTYLFVCSIVLIIVGILAAIIRNEILTWIYVCISLILFSIYLVYDIQLMVGNRRNQYSEEDYVVAALSIYVDIVHIFLMILQILGLADC